MITILENRSILVGFKTNTNTPETSFNSQLIIETGEDSQIVNLNILPLKEENSNKIDGISFFIDNNECKKINKANNKITIEEIEFILWNEGILQIQTKTIYTDTISIDYYLEDNFNNEILNNISILIDKLSKTIIEYLVKHTITNTLTYNKHLNIGHNIILEKEINKINDLDSNNYTNTTIVSYHAFIDDNQTFNELENKSKKNNILTLDNTKVIILLECYFFAWNTTFNNNIYAKEKKEKFNEMLLRFNYIHNSFSCINYFSIYLTKSICNTLSNNTNKHITTSEYRDILIYTSSVEYSLNLHYYILNHNQRVLMNQIDSISKNKELKKTAINAENKIYKIIDDIEDTKKLQCSKRTQDSIFVLTLLTLFAIFEIFYKYILVLHKNIKEDYLYRNTYIILIFIFILIYSFDVYNIKTNIKAYHNRNRHN